MKTALSRWIWTLELRHPNGTPSFSIYDTTVRVYGDHDTPDDTYYYTSSFANLVAQNASRAHLTDVDGGTDTVNFAAGGSAVLLDLAGAIQSTFQGRSLYLNGDFENVIGSEHGDTLWGSAAANRIVGDYGADILAGRAGDDTLIGGAGDDILYGAAGLDRVEGGAGLDLCHFDGAWADYVISFDQATSGYRIALGGVVETVTGVERFAFGSFTADVRQNRDAIVSTAAPTVLDIIGSPPAQGNQPTSGGQAQFFTHICARFTD